MQTNLSHRLAFLAVPALPLLATPAVAQVDVLFSGVSGSATSEVPGLPGLVFNDTTGSQLTFGRPVLSPDGNLVAFRGDLEQSGTFNDGVIVVAPLVNPDEGFALREGTPAPTGGPNAVTVAFDERLSLLDTGAFAFTSQTRDTTTNVFGTDALFKFGPLPADLAVLAETGSSFGGDTVVEGGINSPYLTFGGGAGFNGVLAGAGQAVVFEQTIYQQEGTTPTGAPAPTDVFEFESTYFGEEGQSYLTQARSFPPNRTVDTVIVDGTSVIVGGQVLPNSGFNSVVTDGAVGFAAMNEAGLWYARGFNVDGIEWAVVEGDLVATEGDAIVAGSSETWAKFDGIGVDASGNYVLLGVTSGGEQAVVYNGESVLARTGDMTSIAGLSIRDFSVDDLAFGNSGSVVLGARLLNGSSNAGNALVTVAVPEPGVVGLAATVGLLGLRRRRR
jgi:hypothetical protein